MATPLIGTTKLLEGEYVCERTGERVKVSNNEVHCSQIEDFINCQDPKTRLRYDCSVWRKANLAYMVAQSQPNLTPEPKTRARRCDPTLPFDDPNQPTLEELADLSQVPDDSY